MYQFPSQRESGGLGRSNGLNLVKRTIFNGVVWSVKAYQRLFMDIHVWGREHIPPGPKIYVTNHISALDVGVITLFTEPVHLVVGPAYKTWLATKMLDAMEQINAMPDHRHTVVPEAVKYLQGGESVYICPEGDMQEPCQIGTFYPGVARIYRETGAPLIPIAMLAPKSRMREYPFTTEVDGRVYRTVVILRGPLCFNIGEPLQPEPPEGTDQQQEQFILDALHSSMASLIHDARVNKFWL
jgi:1-acyl-sn-glycerol-3-phosphate acyltransferase